MKSILFITGTRADYGKIKSLIQAVEASDEFEAHIFVSGMHLIERLGNTYREILKDGYRNVYVDFSQADRGIMSYNLGNAICNMTGYVSRIKPDMIVVHGDRIDALAGAIVGALNNIRVVHIEGGEISGTIDESIRHAISKFAHIHMVCNYEAKKRLIQLGEEESRIYVIGSPDIDIMLSNNLPSYSMCRERYDISFDKYGILMYHPVTTEFECIPSKIKEVVSAVLDSGDNFIVIYPNNDAGSEFIMEEYKKFRNNKRFRVFPSIRFEYFLTLLKNAEYIIGNSSAGIRESEIYGIPSIDIGNRQSGRYSAETIKNIQHTDEDRYEIIEAINCVVQYRHTGQHFGMGNSTQMFMEILRQEEIWEFDIQKKFNDLRWSND